MPDKSRPSADHRPSPSSSRRSKTLLAALVLLLMWGGCSGEVPRPASTVLDVQRALTAIERSPWAAVVDGRAVLIESANGWSLDERRIPSRSLVTALAPKEADGDSVIDGPSGQRLAVRAEDRKATDGQPTGNAIIYTDVADATDVVIALSHDGLEELVVWHEPSAAQHLRYEVTLPLGAQVVDDDGAFVVLDGRGRHFVRLAPPRAADADGRDVPVETSFERHGDTEWLLELAVTTRGAAFPVVVDPAWTHGPGFPDESIVGFSDVTCDGCNEIHGDVAVTAAGGVATIGDGVQNSTVNGSVTADAIVVDAGSLVAETASFNQLTLDPNGKIYGSHYTPLSVPVPISVPTVPAFAPGTGTLSPSNAPSQPLPPGNYGDLEIGDNERLELHDEVYTFSSIALGEQARLTCPSLCEIRVQGRVSVGSGSLVGTESEAKAAGVWIFVVGTDGITKAYDAAEESTTRARVFAPNGTIHFHGPGDQFGSFVGESVYLGEGQTINGTEIAGEPSCADFCAEAIAVACDPEIGSQQECEDACNADLTGFCSAQARWWVDCFNESANEIYCQDDVAMKDSCQAYYDYVNQCSEVCAEAATAPTSCRTNYCECSPSSCPGYTFEPFSKGVACEDGNLCNGAETCDGDGNCASGTPVNPDDGNPCTIDSCDPQTGQPTYTNVAAGTSCDTDGNVCNGEDTCDGLGHCQPGIAPPIDDGIPCTTDSCHPTTGVSHVPLPAGTSCDDGDACNGAEICDGTASASSCSPGTPLLIDDGDDCTIQTCDPVTGTISTATCDTNIDLTVASDAYTGNQHLLGTTQKNVTAAFDPKRATVIRGLVTDRAEAPMGAVRVSVMNHPEYGHTFTQPNGEYALMVNGGGQLTVQYDKEGYPQVQRTLFARPLEYAWADDAILTPLDKSTVIDTTGNETSMQVVQASAQSDAHGSRTAVLMVPPGTSASLLMPEQSSVAQSSLTIRITEFTVGDEGPRAMPGDLPPRSRYTWAAEFSADEAIAAGAEQVQFSQPVIGYLDNFYGFPVGISVPVGLYDRTRAAWEATRDGVVLEIVGIDGDGRAEIDTDGSGADDAATLAAWGISDEERTRLAQLFPVGKTLWRAELAHFTPADWNWPPAVPFEVCSPNDASCPLPYLPGPHQPLENACETTGSTIECENQALGQRFPIAGTPFDFVYRSDQTYDHARMRQLRIPIGPPMNPIPATLAKADAHVYVAGRKFKRAGTSMGPFAEWDFDEWDGTDYLGRPTQGPQPATVVLDYWFWVSCSASQGAITQYTFASWGGSATAVPCYDHLHQQSTHFQTTVGGFDAERLGLGGLRVDAQHAFAPTTKGVLYGDGSYRTSEATMGATSTIIQRQLSTYCDPGSGVPALPNSCGNSIGVDVGPDGSVYFVGSVDSGNGTGIRRVDPDGNTHLVAGGGSFTCGSPTCSTLPGPASTAKFAYLTDIEVDGDGNIFVVDSGNNVVVRIDATTQWAEVVAGQCKCESQLASPAVVAPDGTPAKAAELNVPIYLDLAPDGSVVFSEGGRGTGGRIRIVYPNGLMGTVIGGGSSTAFPADPHAFYLDAPRGVAVGPDGSVYTAASNDHMIVRANPGTNKVELVAGTPNVNGVAGDGGLATDATLSSLQDIAVAPNGDLYLIAQVQNVSAGGGATLPGIRKVSGGVISTVAGTNACGASNGICGDGDLALHAKYEGQPKGLAIAPDGSVYFAASTSGLVRIAPPIPNLSAGHYLVPDRDGVTVFEFDGAGRHLKTIDSVLGIERLVFNYETTPDNQTYLKEIVDQNGHKTTFERNPVGELTKATGPFGHETVVTPNGAGRASVITNPEQEATTLTYATATSGLLTGLTFPKGNTKTYAYDTDGLLLEANDPLALAASKVFKTFSLQTWPGYNSRDVTLTTAEGVQTGFEVSWDGEVTSRTVSHPAGYSTQSVHDKASSTLVTTLVDGTTTTVQDKPDPRFGMGAPHQDITLETGTVDAKSVTITSSVTATGLSVANPLALDTLTQSTTVGGRTHSTTVDTTVSPATITSTSHAGRQTVTSLDTGGRATNVAIQSNTLGLVPLELDYYSNPPEPGGQAGFLRFIRRTAGTEIRETELLYDAAGNLVTLDDPLGRTFTRSYDGAARLTQQAFPDLSAVGFDYDANGLLDELAQPGSPPNPLPNQIHTFEGNAVDLPWRYIYPGTAAVAARTTEYAYNLDRQLDLVTMPAGSIDYVYESSPATGRLHKVVETWPGAQVTETVTSYFQAPDPREGKVQTIAYDAVAPANDVSLAFDYDGQMLTSVSWSGAVAGSVSYGYDAELRVDSLTYGGGTTSYARADADGLLTSAGALVLTRDAETGLVTKTELTSTSTVTEDYGYNAFGELDAQTYTHDATNLLDTGLKRDALGRIACKTETVFAQATTHTEYVYDDADRLWKVSSCPGPCDQGGCTLVAEYQYDANGNRNIVIESGTTSAGFDPDDRITHQGAVTYTHDDNGSRLTRVDGAGTTTYTYDLFSRLHAVSMPGPVTVDYVIDGLGRRVAKSKNGALERSWIYLDGLRIGAEIDHTQAPTVTSRFVYGSRMHVPDYMERAGELYRLVTDHLGSVRLVVKVSDGSIAQRIDYDAWGNPTLMAGTWDVQPFGFAGGLYDPDTGLYRFGARDYDPEVGRWVTKDPIGFGGGRVNLFSYVGSDPVNSVDPSGLAEIWIVRLLRHMGKHLKPQKLEKISLDEAINLAKHFDEDILVKGRKADEVAHKIAQEACDGGTKPMKHQGHYHPRDAAGGKKGSHIIWRSYAMMFFDMNGSGSFDGEDVIELSNPFPVPLPGLRRHVTFDECVEAGGYCN